MKTPQWETMGISREDGATILQHPRGWQIRVPKEQDWLPLLNELNFNSALLRERERCKRLVEECHASRRELRLWHTWYDLIETDSQSDSVDLQTKIVEARKEAATARAAVDAAGDLEEKAE